MAREHDGAYAFTVGQRRGLRLGVPAPDGRPRYVLDVSPVDRTVTVGPREALTVSGAVGVRPRWSGPRRSAPFGAARRSERTHGAVPARARLQGDELLVTLRRAVQGLASGQAVVIYVGDRVVGSATVDRTVAVRGVTEALLRARPTGVGSMPGTDVREATRVVLGELPDCPTFPSSRRAGSART